MGISVIIQVRTQSLTYLGNAMLPGPTFIGAINVVNKTPVKMTKKVSVTYTSKKLSDGNSEDIFPNHEYKFKQEELRIAFKFFMNNLIKKLMLVKLFLITAQVDFS
jgi:hypothetical protein